jgi:hypothetical protein
LADVFSRRLVQAPSSTGGPHLAYTVPGGLVAVVKSISIVWGDVTVSGLDAWVVDDSLAKLVRRTISAGTEPYETGGGCDVFQGWWVYMPGETLSVQTASGTCDFLASGYELTLP